MSSTSDIESWEFWTPTQMMDKFLDGTLEKFDFVFTYSSLEHTGLGKVNLVFRQIASNAMPQGGMVTV